MTGNYERLLFTTATPARQNVAMRVGLGVYYFELAGGISSPLTVSYLVGGNHRLEIGAGLVVGTGGTIDGSVSWIFLTGLIGYRYQKVDSGFVFRIGCTPIFSFLPLVGPSLGKAF